MMLSRKEERALKSLTVEQAMWLFREGIQHFDNEPADPDSEQAWFRGLSDLQFEAIHTMILAARERLGPTPPHIQAVLDERVKAKLQ